MPEHSQSLEVAIAFTSAWTSRDLTTAAKHISDQIVFEDPLATS